MTLRICWYLLAALCFFAWLTRPHEATEKLINAEYGLLIFLVICALLVEFAALMLFRSMIHPLYIDCRIDGLGDARISRQHLHFVFVMRTGPQGLSRHMWLLPRSAGFPSPIPRILVYQVLLRTSQPHPVKYIVLAESRSHKAAMAMAQRLAKELDVKVFDKDCKQAPMSDPRWANALRAMTREAAPESKQDPPVEETAQVSAPRAESEGATS